MSQYSELLSAYLDGELPQKQRIALEAKIGNNAELAAELEALAQADKVIADQFDDVLDDMLDVGASDTSLLSDIEAQIMAAKLTAPKRVAANSNIRWQSVAAGFAMLVLGGIGGYIIHGQTVPQVQKVQKAQIASADNWLTHVAGYHGIYAKQKRHLVEVPASESAHITSWLSNTTGVEFTIPQLADAGFQFQGARLLGAKGQPIAQLIYTDPDGKVVAICLKMGTSNANQNASENANQNAGENGAGFALTNLNDFNIVSWSKNAADYLVIGDVDAATLQGLAQSVELEI